MGDEDTGSATVLRFELQMLAETTVFTVTPSLHFCECHVGPVFVQVITKTSSATIFAQVGPGGRGGDSQHIVVWQVLSTLFTLASLLAILMRRAEYTMARAGIRIFEMQELEEEAGSKKEEGGPRTRRETLVEDQGARNVLRIAGLEEELQFGEIVC